MRTSVGGPFSFYHDHRGGNVLALGLGYIIANKMSRPVKQLIEASAQVSQGNLAPVIGPISKSEIGLLQKNIQRDVDLSSGKG